MVRSTCSNTQAPDFDNYVARRNECASRVFVEIIAPEVHPEIEINDALTVVLLYDSPC